MARPTTGSLLTKADFRKESQVRYYAYAPDLFEREFGRRLSRNTLYKYVVRGFPVRKGGPYVKVPIFQSVRRTMTTREAMKRFIQRVRQLERKPAQADQTAATAAHAG